MDIVELWRHVKNLSASSAHRSLLLEREQNESLRHGITDLLLDLKQGQVQLGQQVGQVIAQNEALRGMMETMITGTHSIPTLAILLPTVATGWTSRLSPMRFVRHQDRLYFLCSHTHQIAPCGPKGTGYKIKVTKQWVQDAAPVLRVGLVLVKLALMASGLPLPVPDLCSMLEGSAMHAKYLDSALQLVSHPPNDVVGNTDSEFSMNKTISDVAQYGVKELLADQGEGFEMRLQEGSRKAYETIQTLLNGE